MKRYLLLLAALGAAVAALAGSAGAITGNYTDDFVHDNVGLLVFYTPNTPAGEDPFSHRCSGTLISPTVVVTAGHCTTGVDSGRIYFQQSAAPNYDPNAFGGWGGDPTTGYPYEGGITFQPGGQLRLPRRLPGDEGRRCRRARHAGDAAERLRHPADGGRDRRYIAAAGDKKQARFTVSGYGLSDQDPRPVSFRERLMANSYAINNEAPITEFNLKTTANASQGKGGTCNGDSAARSSSTART